MGGIGSGARRTTNVGAVEGALALDIRALRRLGLVRAGECVCDTVRWPSRGLGAASARLRADLEAVERGGSVTIIGTMADGRVAQHVDVEAIGSRIGGWRCYFLCPVTAKRCEILYYSNGRFASREAQRLTYATQGMTDLSRLHRRVAKLRGRLCGSSGQPSPRGRNRIEMVDMAAEVERIAKAMYRQRLGAAIERSGAQRMPAR